MAKRIPKAWPQAIAVVAAAALGTTAWTLWPTALPLAPAAAAELYGNRPSRHSAAPGGVLTLARWLGAQGYQVQSHAAAVPPTTEVLFLLAPSFAPGAQESEALLGWVQRGGRLVYAPQVVAFTAPTSVLDELKAPVLQELTLDETLGPLLRQVGREVEATPTHQRLAVGRGQVVMVHHGPRLLTNVSLSGGDPAVSLAFLLPLLQGTLTIAFDEGRLGVEPPPGLWGVLRASRYRAMPWWLFGVAGLWLWATGIRRQPREDSTKRPPGARTCEVATPQVLPLLLVPTSQGVRVALLVALAALLGTLLKLTFFGGWLAGAVLVAGGVDAVRLWRTPAPELAEAETQAMGEVWLWTHSPWRWWCRRYAIERQAKVSAS